MCPPFSSSHGAKVLFHHICIHEPSLTSTHFITSFPLVDVLHQLLTLPCIFPLSSSSSFPRIYRNESIIFFFSSSCHPQHNFESHIFVFASLHTPPKKTHFLLIVTHFPHYPPLDPPPHSLPPPHRGAMFPIEPCVSVFASYWFVLL